MNRSWRLPLSLALAAIILAVVYSCSSKDNSTEPVKLVYRLINGQYKAGYLDFCWNQRDKSGHLVSAGAYQAHIVAGAFERYVDFTISAQASHVVAPVSCDTATFSPLKPSGELPDQFSLYLNSPAYASGDSIGVSVGLPVSCSCLVEVVEK